MAQLCKFTNAYSQVAREKPLLVGARCPPSWFAVLSPTFCSIYWGNGDEWLVGFTPHGAVEAHCVLNTWARAITFHSPGSGDMGMCVPSHRCTDPGPGGKVTYQRPPQPVSGTQKSPSVKPSLFHSLLYSQHLVYRAWHRTATQRLNEWMGLEFPSKDRRIYWGEGGGRRALCNCFSVFPPVLRGRKETPFRPKGTFAPWEGHVSFWGLGVSSHGWVPKHRALPLDTWGTPQSPFLVFSEWKGWGKGYNGPSGSIWNSGSRQVSKGLQIPWPRKPSVVCYHFLHTNIL